MDNKALFSKSSAFRIVNCCIVSLLLLLAFLNPQTIAASDALYGWTKTIGGTGTEIAGAVKVDSEGNIFITGSFQNTVDFDPSEGTDNHTSNGSYDVF